MNAESSIAAFTGLIDLAAERLGGKALSTSDDFFAPMENLLKPGRGVFIEDKYTDRGKWMDGWESRRKRTPGYDWCIIALGVPGIIRAFDIDTNHFLGNHPAYASVDACTIIDGEAPTEETNWIEILPQSPLRSGSRNLFAVAEQKRYNHVRLNIYPDGGVARFRVYGSPAPEIKSGREIDLLAIENGGSALAASDMFFSPAENLIMPGRGATMGDGWESRRRRGPGNDWAILKFCAPGIIKKIKIDTNHFKGNYPDRVSVEVCHAISAKMLDLVSGNPGWVLLLPETKLQADREQIFDIDTKISATHLRINMYPDGGISRLRAYGYLP